MKIHQFFTKSGTYQTDCYLYRIETSIHSLRGQLALLRLRDLLYVATIRIHLKARLLGHVLKQKQ